MKEDQKMKSMGKWKKKAAVMMATVMMASSLTVPVMAHGHGHGCGGGGHHSVCSTVRHPSGVYCSYHNARHKTKARCKRYCPKHKLTHANGKIHKVRHHAARR